MAWIGSHFYCFDLVELAESDGLSFISTETGDLKELREYPVTQFTGPSRQEALNAKMI